MIEIQLDPYLFWLELEQLQTETNITWLVTHLDENYFHQAFHIIGSLFLIIQRWYFDFLIEVDNKDAVRHFDFVQNKSDFLLLQMGHSNW